MSQSLEWARLWTTKAAEQVAENRELLIELDREIGDGDHGENLDRGYTAVIRGDGLQDAQDGSDLLKYVAKTLLSTVGGAAGPLYGTAYLKASQQFPSTELTGVDIANILEAAVGGVQMRGKASAGEKTMVDAWLPAAQAAREACVTQGVLGTLEAAAQGAALGAEKTLPMRATKGRASYLGERSIGHRDPGAVSSAIILEAAAEAAREVYASGEAE